MSFLTPFTPGQPATIQVVASTNGLLNAWLDFNAAGSWADAGDQIFTNKPLVGGTNLLSVTVPSSALHTNSTFARFRFSSASGLSYTNLAPDGEVEDYQVSITCPQPTLSAVKSGTNYTLTFATTTTCTYHVEYKNALTNATWTALQNVPGTGGTVTVTDTNAASQTRFYRARVD